jgi:hypothetical protein
VSRAQRRRAPVASRGAPDDRLPQRAPLTHEASNEGLGAPHASAPLDGSPGTDGEPSRVFDAGDFTVTSRRDELDNSLDVMRDNLGRADAFITAAEDLIERPGGESKDDDGLGRHRNHVAHLVESAKLAVRAAICAGHEIAATVDKHRVET